MKIGVKLRRSQAISPDDGNVSRGKKNFHFFDLGQTQVDLEILYLSQDRWRTIGMESILKAGGQ